jgi:carbamoyl-phosphate synthase small subunit
MGEIVFHTALTGYQEILTDPSYRGQIVVMTYPHIGNYGVTHEDEEAGRAWVEGFVVREHTRLPSNFRSAGSLGDYLRERGIPAIDGLDTRRLTRHVRTQGALRAMITTDETAGEPELVERVRSSPSTSDVDHVKAVTCARPYHWTRGYESPFAPLVEPPSGERIRLVAVDYGAKRNILRSLVVCGFDVHVVPATATAAEIRALSPEALFLSNGPGDPALLGYAVETVADLVADIPTFGICLGHQILSQVFGGKTFKLKFGHHGANHPVMDLATRRVEITSQNHSFAVDPESLPSGDLEVTHVNLNDRTVEGFAHKRLPVHAVQYHPEAAPGPHDALYLFAQFRRRVLEVIR